MAEFFIGFVNAPALASVVEVLDSIKNLFLVFLGFSAVIFVHELGHFMAAKWCDVRVDKFAVGFGRAIFSWRKGIGFRWGPTDKIYRQRVNDQVAANRAREGLTDLESEPTDTEVTQAASELGLGETEYCFNVLPLGGYVKMLGQEDFAVDKSGELKVKEDPRAFIHKPIGQRMIIVSAGVVMNLVFAAIVFMLVFMIGMQAPPAEVGLVLPNSPADRAGLRQGDIIKEINGRGISDRSDLITAVVLADRDEPLKITYTRQTPGTKQETTHTVEVRPEMMPGEDTLKIGVAAPVTTEIGLVAQGDAVPPEYRLQVGDKVIAANGRLVDDFTVVEAITADALGQWVDLTVLRSQPDGEPEKAHAQVRSRLVFAKTGPAGKEDENLLGFVPRRLWNEYVDEGQDPVSNLRRGDVIVRWGGILAPRMSEIYESIQRNPGKEISVVVLRDGKEQTVTVQPRTPPTFGRHVEPLVTQSFWAQEIGPPVVADIVTEVTPEIKTPAAVLVDVMPRGSRLTRINDQAVSTWSDVVRAFIELAGQDVTIHWVYEGTPEQSATIHVPATLDTALDLPISSVITSINGKSRVEVENKGRAEAHEVNTAVGQRAVLKELLEQGVDEATITYTLLLDPGTRTATVKISEEMLDAWTKRIAPFGLDVYARPKLITIQERNPLKAMMVGIWKTYYFIEHVYLMMDRMLISRTVSMDQVSGPVGIFKMGGDFADLGIVYLLYFLALISANLAVINFLPLPIVDGGLFVFLLIEKIKGSPISLKVQVATQVIGLALIVSIFLYVTFQDILKIW